MKKFAILLIIALAASLGLAAMPAFPNELTEADAGQVSIVRGSTINLVSRESSIPIVVTNSLPGEVRVIVRLSSNSPKLLVLDDSVQLVIPAETTMNAQFPIQAIGSGNVVMVAWLTSLSGIELGKRVPIRLTVNPDIEAAAIVLFLSFVAVLIVVGIYRTARKRRNELRT